MKDHPVGRMKRIYWHEKSIFLEARIEHLLPADVLLSYQGKEDAVPLVREQHTR